MNRSKKPHFVFFGTPNLAVIVLQELKEKGLSPDLIITSPDTPQGRKLALTPPPVKVWAEENDISYLQPKTLSDPALVTTLNKTTWDLFIVAAYGKIIPQTILDIPTHGTLNVHPSLLPLYRGPSPIISQIVGGEKQVGVSIMLLDEKVDHGPIIQQEMIPMPHPSGESSLPTAGVLEDELAHLGGALLAKVIPLWVEGAIEAQEQDHHRRTLTKLITKEDGLLDLDGDPEENYRKIKAFDPWPKAYYFTRRGSKEIRVRVTDAKLKDGTLVITRVIPEGKKEMGYEDFLRG